MPSPAKYVQPIHFEDFDGSQFERLVFTYHARIEKWKSLEWYGQSGSDLGRDIWGIRKNGTQGDEFVCIQCVNRKNLTFAKVEKDISKILKAANGTPHTFRIVTRSNISAEMRDRIKKHARTLGVNECDIWSGAEFEEFLRSGAESLLKRFVEGETFPDAAHELLAFAKADGPMNDNDALALIAKLFDRPAFYTPIHAESNLGDFKQAITDTIQALGTGIWKARDGHLITRIPSRQQLQDEVLRRNFKLSRRPLRNFVPSSMNWSSLAPSATVDVATQIAPCILCRRSLRMSWSNFAMMRSDCFAMHILHSTHRPRGDAKHTILTKFMNVQG
jgi:hypothetical protein